MAIKPVRYYIRKGGEGGWFVKRISGSDDEPVSVGFVFTNKYVPPVRDEDDERL